MTGPDSGAAPDHAEVEDRQVLPPTDSVDATDQPCPHCGHDPIDDVSALEAITAAKNMIVRRQATIDAYYDAFDQVWTLSAPSNWRRSLRGLLNAGLPRSAMVDAARIALDADHVPTSRRFVYFMGAARNRLRDMDGYALERMLREL
ncbi:hypothetical protein ACFQ0K_17845 [Nocardioides caeni]|uniref:Uncharacterized protein n=1 Tax=Nocardioides caeni TaxID=574700 RepID=A0A4S8NBX0_9ACTN|nr:hypothetical protein [Nocardioides caeni]THV13371.1 hypothetical protein E9934_10440 [Nocardioides caeni]